MSIIPAKTIFEEYVSEAISNFVSSDYMVKHFEGTIRKTLERNYPRLEYSQLELDLWIEELELAIESIGTGNRIYHETLFSEIWLPDILKFYLEFLSSLFQGVVENYDRR